MPWWRSGWGRGDQAADDWGQSAETGLSNAMTPAGDSRQISRLLDLAAKRATGALHVNGRGGGVVFLERGEVVHVESSLTPGLAALLLRPVSSDERWSELVAALRNGDDDAGTAAATSAAAEVLRAEDTSPVHVEILRRGAMADAALPVLGGSAAARGRSRFRPGERHWCPPAGTLGVRDLLAEVSRRAHVLTRLTPGVHPDLPVRRSAHLPFSRIRLTASQWDVVRLAGGGGRTPLDIAWLLGHGVFATTVTAHELVHLGVLTVSRGPDAAPATAGVLPPRHVLSFLRATTDTAATPVTAST
jgi:hypothetical protein